jgi:hypothetical protein
MTKSPPAVTRLALGLAAQSLPAFSSKFSRKDFTQHQHFALLVLKTFFKTDSRGVVQMLVDFAELRDELGLTKVPDHSTICKAEKRLLIKGISFSSSSRRPCAPSKAA